MLKELEDRLRKIPETEITKKRKPREGKEEENMINEDKIQGVISPIGTREIHKQITKKLINKVEITVSDFDPTQPDKKPVGWADMKLRKVYMKEWQDRRDGLGEFYMKQ